MYFNVVTKSTDWTGGFPGWVGPAVTFVLFLGAAAIYLRGSFAAGTIKALQANNLALTDRVLILEKSDKDKDNHIAQQDIRIEALERENAALISQRPSAEMIAKIDANLDRYIFARDELEREREQVKLEREGKA